MRGEDEGKRKTRKMGGKGRVEARPIGLRGEGESKMRVGSHHEPM